MIVALPGWDLEAEDVEAAGWLGCAGEGGAAAGVGPWSVIELVAVWS
jgi:hypothetical protein